MKKITSLICLILVIIAACKQNKSTEETATGNTAVNKQFIRPANKFAGIQMASKKDTSCGMPLSAGLEDTVQLDGKVYGFCSPECKQDFITKLISEKKR